MNSNERSYMQNEIPESSNCFYMLVLKFIDISMSSVLIAPCVVAYWRGTWELIELLMLPMNSTVSAFISFAVGIVGHVFFTICQGTFKKSFDPDKKRLTYYIVSRSYTAVFGVVCVNMWRGTWNLCDNLTSKTSLGIVLLTTLLSLLILILIRTTRNLTAAPFVISTDHKSTYFEISTIFKTEKFHRSTLYILDTFFSIIVVGTLVVVAWRGVWEMLDLTFYRNNELISAFGSLIAGYGLVVIMFALQPIFQRTCKSVNESLKLVLADCYYIISFIGAVNVWRGIWIFLDVNLYPDNQFKSYYVSHVIAYLTLTTLNCANSILVRGIAIDGEEGDSGCIEFSVAYVKQHFYNKKVQKYLKNEAQKQKNNLASKIN